MTAAAFDTLAAMRRLEAAGIDATHAEAIIDTVRDSAGELATKGDIAHLDGRLSALDSRIDALESRLNTLQWVVGIQSAITLATFTIVAAKLL